MRLAALDDIPGLVEMARSLHETHEARFPFNADDIANWFSAMIESNLAYIARTDGGFVAGILAPAPQNREWLVAYEVFLWAGDGTGLELMRGFEEWAAMNGAKEVKFSHPVNDRLSAFFKRNGHRPSEISYTKGAISCA